MTAFADQLRRTISSGDYQAAQGLLAAHSATIQTAEEARQALDLLEWARRLASAQRAGDSAQLGSLSAPARPYVRYQAPVHTWKLEG